MSEKTKAKGLAAAAYVGLILAASLCAQGILAQDRISEGLELGARWREEEAKAKMAAAAAWLDPDHEILPHPFDVRKYSLDLDIDMEGGTLRATAVINCLSEEDGLDQISLNFAGSWNIELVHVDGKAVDWNHNGSALVIDFDKERDTGKAFTVTVRYNGTPANDIYHRWPAFIIESTQAYTFSQPFQARYWFPCFDEPSDKADDGCQITVRMPPGMVSASNGLMVDNKSENGKTVTVWRHSFPIATYLMSVAVARYQVQRSYYKEIPITNYVYSSAAWQAQQDFIYTSEMMEYFSGLFGEYPFEKYGMAMVVGFGGAMEHQTMTFYGDTLVTGDRTYEWIVAHELSHHWWGDAVTIADYRDIWLNEGFASYCEALWAEHRYGAVGRDTSVQNSKQRYLEEDRYDRHSVYRTDYNIDHLFSTTVYRKGALILHMLRWELGDENFFNGLKEYFRRHKYGTVETQDLIDAMESVSGRDLEAFFEGWVYGTGYPEYEICSYYTTGAQGSPAGSGQQGATAVITVHQAQSDPTVFAMTLPIDPDGDGALPVQRRYIEGRWRQFEVSAPAVAGKAHIQESSWLLMTLLGQADYPAPAITGLKNRKFTQGNSGEFIISGRNFTPVTSFALSSADIGVTSILVDEQKGTATMALEVPADHKTGAVDLTIINPDGDTVVKKKALRIKKSRR